MEKYKAVKCELRSAKTSHAKQLENRFVTNIPEVMWKSLQELTRYKTKSPVPSDADPEMPANLKASLPNFSRGQVQAHTAIPKLSPIPTPFITETNTVRGMFCKLDKNKTAGPDRLIPALPKKTGPSL